MIDFRYHLVSLVSVFLALAVGIVLGAGPLKDTISDTLTNQVDALRADKVDLQQAVGAREDDVAQRDAFIDEIAPGLVADQVGGRSVVVVTLPGTPGSTTDAVESRLESAGAQVTGRVNLLPAWVSPDQAAFRAELASRFVDLLDPRPDAGTGATGELAAVLARGIVAQDVGDADLRDEDAVSVVEGLRAGDLVAVDGDVTTARATLAVVLAPSAQDTAPDGTQPREAVAGWTAVAAALDDASAGTVIAGARQSAADGGLVAAVRDDDEVSQEVSTVDDVDSPAGEVATVLAVREQLAGGVGHYGFGEGAQAPLPGGTQG